MKRVAVIPLKQFLEARSDSELLTQLAASVERVATAKYLRKFADRLSMQPQIAKALNAAAEDIENGEHVR